MTRWEYKTIVRSRVVDYRGTGEWNIDISPKLVELGNQGWELVTVAPRSDNAHSATNNQINYAGITTTDVWVFKRPQSPSSTEGPIEENRPAQMGSCPNCSKTIPLACLKCPQCGAQFGSESAWQVKRLIDGSEKV
jgi:hypothetical protein